MERVKEVIISIHCYRFVMYLKSFTIFITELQ